MREATRDLPAAPDLGEGAQLYRSLVEMSPDAMVIRQGDCFAFVNQSAVRLLGAKSAEDLLGKSIYDLVHPDDRSLVRHRQVRHDVHGEMLPPAEVRMRRADGSYVAIESIAAPVEFDGRKAALAIWRDLTARKRSDQQYSERVKQLLFRLVDAQESERRALASALHDLIGQKLTALNIGLDILKRDLHATTGPLVRARLDSIAGIVDETVDAIRDVMADLHPPELDDFGLVPALHAHAKQFEARTGMDTTVDALEPYPRLARNVELALFRVVQEALTNAIKHSGASAIRIRAWRDPQCAFIAVEDNGHGFTDPAGARSVWRGGWGLPEMRKRAEAVGGTLQIEFPEAGGTRVLVHVAIEHAD